MIPVFGLSYYIYAQTNLDFSMIIDKSFGVMIGIFGGVATLAAAYIASLLYTDWRVVQTDVFKQSLASTIYIKLNGMVACLDKYHDFIYEYNNSVIDADFIANASQKYKELIEEYSILEHEFQQNISNFEEVFLDHKQILTTEETIEFKYYYYDITHILNIISDGKNFTNMDVKIKNLKRRKIRFTELKTKITGVLIPCINLKEN